jgi:hypothetical protein
MMFLPFTLHINTTIGIKMTFLLLFGHYIGQSIKDLIKLPRPSHQKVCVLEKEFEAEYGAPSMVIKKNKKSIP